MKKNLLLQIDPISFGWGALVVIVAGIAIVTIWALWDAKKIRKRRAAIQARIQKDSLPSTSD